jgi:membrane-bound serine protease (ClpP class)
MLIMPSVQAAGNTSEGVTHIIPIEGIIDNGNRMFIERSHDRAIEAGADVIIFEINTNGGFLDDAIDIKDIILGSPAETYTFVNTRAISAGALIAMAGDNLIMHRGGTMGAAEPQTCDGERADEKAMSLWIAQLRGVAEDTGRDPEVAAAMADVYLVIEGVSEEGSMLTLTPREAIDLGMADIILDTRREVMSHFELPYEVYEHVRTEQDRIIGFLSNPLVSGILLLIGIAGLAIEIFSAGSFGIFGVAGIFGFVLFFMGNFLAGHATAGAMLLFGAGVLLIMLEIFVLPGFGVAGIGGILAMFAGIILAAPSISQGIITLVLALVISIGFVIFSVKNKKTSKFWNRLALHHTEAGYTSVEGKFDGYQGKQGKAVTMLRPAGTALVDGRRVDVVTQGEFIEAETPIEVILVEGARIVVQEKKPEMTL